MKNKFCGHLKVYGACFAAFFLGSCSRLTLFHPKGPVAHEEVFLLYVTFAIMAVIVISVFAMAFWFSTRYRASNKKADYQPHWETSVKIELLIWLIPVAIIAFLSYLTWTRTYQLDPYKPIQSDVKPLNIEVVSMDWNWLFIYPENNIATVNELVVPSNTPLSFRLTSETVMTSFFIPQLGSQMYAMAGMQTKLHLLADTTGVFDGQNQEFSGQGYDTMHFKVIVKQPAQFETWVEHALKSPRALSPRQYKKLSDPHANHPVTIYSPVSSGLFDSVVHRFTGWMGPHDKMKMKMQLKEQAHK